MTIGFGVLIIVNSILFITVMVEFSRNNFVKLLKEKKEKVKRIPVSIIITYIFLIIILLGVLGFNLFTIKTIALDILGL